MFFILEQFLFFFQISLILLTLTISGFVFKKFLFQLNENFAVEENALFGFILIGFLALFINFFLPLNYITNNILILLIIITGVIFKFFNQDIFALLKKIIFVSLLAYLFIIYSTFNRPDAFLYHLPYSNIINENKIILGLSNIHHRFAHISIFQYISSFFVNDFFKTNGLIIPVSLLTSSFLIYTFNKFNSDFKKKDKRRNSIFIFFILIISFYSFNRYSGWGNDAQLHIFYFLFFIYLLDFIINKHPLIEFKKLSIISVFLFLIKPFYVISLLVPLFIFLKFKNKIIILKSKFFLFTSLLVIFWFLKNILISGCLIYPVKHTCMTNLSWYNSATESKALEGEAWSKDWPNRLNNEIKFQNYIKNFNWLDSWLKNHFKVVIEKIFPVLIFIFINFLIFYFSNCLKKNSYRKYEEYFQFLLFFNLFGILVWFLKFPLYIHLYLLF